MNIFTFFKLFGNETRISTTTLADIEDQLDEKSRLEEVQPRAAAIIKHGYGYIPAPPGAFVVDNSASPAEVTHNDDMVLTAFMVYDKDGSIPADEWEKLNREANEYIASLPPMRLDPITGRPVRDF